MPARQRGNDSTAVSGGERFQTGALLDQSALAHAHTYARYVVAPRSPVAADRKRSSPTPTGHSTLALMATKGLTTEG